MPKAKRFNLETVEKGKKILREVPPKNEVLQAEVIAKLLPDIFKVLDKGYTLKEVQKMLSAGGLDLHMAKLKQAVDTARAAKSGEKKKGLAVEPSLGGDAASSTNNVLNDDMSRMEKLPEDAATEN